LLFKRRRPRAVAGRPSCGVRAECTGFDAVRARLWARDPGYSGLHPERPSGAPGAARTAANASASATGGKV